MLFASPFHIVRILFPLGVYYNEAIIRESILLNSLSLDSLGPASICLKNNL